MSSLYLRGVQMMSGKIKLQKYLKIRKGTLKGCSNDAKKKYIKLRKYLKIRKGTKNLKIPNSLPLLNSRKIKMIKKLE